MIHISMSSYRWFYRWSAYIINFENTLYCTKWLHSIKKRLHPVEWLFRVASLHIIRPGRSVMVPEVVAISLCFFNMRRHLRKNYKRALQYARWLTTLKPVYWILTHAYISSPHWRQKRKSHRDADEITWEKLVYLASIRLRGIVIARNRKIFLHHHLGPGGSCLYIHVGWSWC